MKKIKKAAWYDYVYATGGNDGMYNKPVEQFEDHKIWLDVLSMIPKEKPILDIGCGVGMLAELCLKTGHNYFWGFDFSPVALEKAQARVPKGKFTLIDFSTQIIPRVRDSAVLIFETLEHVRNDKALVDFILAGCHVFITVPNFDSESHVRHFSSMEEVIERYGDMISITHKKEYATNDVNKLFLIGGIRNGN